MVQEAQLREVEGVVRLAMRGRMHYERLPLRATVHVHLVEVAEVQELMGLDPRTCTGHILLLLRRLHARLLAGAQMMVEEVALIVMAHAELQKAVEVVVAVFQKGVVMAMKMAAEVGARVEHPLGPGELERESLVVVAAQVLMVYGKKEVA
jgi:hypothetical protein